MEAEAIVQVRAQDHIAQAQDHIQAREVHIAAAQADQVEDFQEVMEEVMEEVHSHQDHQDRRELQEHHVILHIIMEAHQEEADLHPVAVV